MTAAAAATTAAVATATTTVAVSCQGRGLIGIVTGSALGSFVAR